MKTTGSPDTVTDWALGFAAFAVGTVAILSAGLAAGLSLLEVGVLLLPLGLAFQALGAMRRRRRSA
jgi:hypothetical protein